MVYLMEGGLWNTWCSNDVHESYVLGLQKSIRRDMGEFSGHTSFKVVDGSKIRF